MLHLPVLISDLTLILGAAAFITLVFKKLKQPVVLGYIIAGLLVGPNFNLFPTVVEIKSIQIWADIGVIFLLFGLGLEFSFKKLLAVGGVAVITAFTGVGMTMTIGYILGKSMGWNNMDCLFLGGILAIASTTIIIRAFDELGVKTQKFTGIVTGVLVIEDLVAVVLMVVLTTLSISRSFEGSEMIGSILKLVFFLILWFISGIFFLPTLLKRLQKLLNEETLLIVSLALCLASEVGFSPALGAFIMGSILAETTKAEKIEHTLKPVKDLFGAIFFVSVGMLINPQMMVIHFVPILIATLVLLIGKPLFVSIGALIAGQPLKIAVQTGMSLSQIGEFSFIIATLGLTLNVTSDFLYPIAVAVSVLTTFTTPFMIRLSPFVYNKVESWIPLSWNIRLGRYIAGAQNISKTSDWKRLLRFYFLNIVIFSVIIITVILMSTKYILPSFSEYQGGKEITAGVTLILLSPFLWALAFRRTQAQAYASVWVKPLQRGPLILLMLTRVGLALFYIGFLFETLYSLGIAIAGVVLASVLLILFRKKIKTLYGKIELRFLENYNFREEQTKELDKPLAPWDTHLSTFELNAQSPYIGKTLLESEIRESFGVNIAIIERGNRTINVPSREERLYPYDLLSVIGTDEQLKSFKEHLESTKSETQFLAPKQTVTLQNFTITQNSLLLGKNIRHSGIRESTKGLVVGIERKGVRILNPESDTVFELYDIVWIVGNSKRITILSKEQSSK
jgi:monovalent cation:H+ antiporter-2, CPA2 family